MPATETTHPQVRILGPIEAVGSQGPVTLTGARQRGLLAILAMNAGTVVHPSKLIDALWGVDPPRTALKTLHSHIARVRQALETGGLNDTLRTQHQGYVLAVPPEAVDAHRFEATFRVAQRDLAGSDPAGGGPRQAASALRDALALWRGDALADGEPTGWAAAEAERLNDLRVAAIEEMWAAELRVGRHLVAVGELERLMISHPHRERMTGLYMLALYRVGRPTEALEAYQRLRERLAEELGTDPGPWLQQLHTGILRRDPALDVETDSGLDPAPDPDAPDLDAPHLDAPAGSRPAVPGPAQLPAPVGHFTGRAGQLADLDAALDRAGPQPRVVVMSGQAGIGKTALAVEWAHRVAGQFPDGQIFLDLGGPDPETATTPADALLHALSSLGVPSGRIPGGVSARSSLYRSILHDRRVLVVLDNCGGPDDILPLVPATGSSLLLATTRTRPTALATRCPVAAIELDALDQHEAVALLRRVIGPERVDREPERASELALLCGRMPLALRIAAAKLAGRAGRRIADMTAELTHADRLDELCVPGDSRSVRAVFASAYRSLSAPAARVFRLLGLHPGPNLSAHLVAAAMPVALPAARRALDELAMAHLVTEVGPDRYRGHDLLRLYARERAGSDEDSAARAVTLARILDWYVTVAAAANRLIDPGRDRIVPVPRFPEAGPSFPEDHQAALAFLDGERPNLLPVVRYATEHGDDAVAWQLTYLLTGFFDSRGHWAERVELCRLGVAAAQRHGDPGVEGLMRSGLGVAHIMTHRFTDALEALQQSLTLMRACGDRRGEGHAYNNIAVASSRLRRFDDAVDALQHALALHAANDDALGVTVALNNIGDAYVRMGRPELSFEYLSRALELARANHSARLEAAVLSGLGQAELSLGRHPDGLEYLGRALTVRQHIGDRRSEADTHNNIGVAQLDLADHPAALAAFQQALALSKEIADQHLESVVLANIGRTHLARGDAVAAGSYLRLALTLRTLAPDDYETANILRSLGDLDRWSGNEAGARAQWGRAVDLYRSVNATAEADQLAPLLRSERRQPSPV